MFLLQGRLLFKVRWKNCGPEDDYWVGLEEIDSTEVLHKYFLSVLTISKAAVSLVSDQNEQI